MLVWYSTQRLTSPIQLNENFIIHNNDSVLVFHAMDMIKSPQRKIKKEQTVFFPYYPLTEAGRQLLPIVRTISEYNYMLELGNAINCHSKNLIRTVTAHQITRFENNSIYFDEADLLNKN